MGTRSKTQKKNGDNRHTVMELQGRQKAKQRTWDYGTRSPGTKVKMSDRTFIVSVDGSYRRRKEKV